jgi:hypothetical protein
VLGWILLVLATVASSAGRPPCCVLRMCAHEAKAAAADEGAHCPHCTPERKGEGNRERDDERERAPRCDCAMKQGPAVQAGSTSLPEPAPLVTWVAPDHRPADGLSVLGAVVRAHAPPVARTPGALPLLL